MATRLYPVLEHPVVGFTFTAGSALARIVEAHDDLSPLLDFHAPDPAQIAIEVGMVYPYEEDGADDLAELDLGQPEWHEPAVGLGWPLSGTLGVPYETGPRASPKRSTTPACALKTCWQTWKPWSPRLS